MCFFFFFACIRYFLSFRPFFFFPCSALDGHSMQSDIFLCSWITPFVDLEHPISALHEYHRQHWLSLVTAFIRYPYFVELPRLGHTCATRRVGLSAFLQKSCFMISCARCASICIDRASQDRSLEFRYLMAGFFISISLSASLDTGCLFFLFFQKTALSSPAFMSLYVLRLWMVALACAVIKRGREEGTDRGLSSASLARHVHR